MGDVEGFGIAFIEAAARGVPSVAVVTQGVLAMVFVIVSNPQQPFLEMLDNDSELPYPPPRSGRRRMIRPTASVVGPTITSRKDRRWPNCGILIESAHMTSRR